MLLVSYSLIQYEEKNNANYSRTRTSPSSGLWIIFYNYNNCVLHNLNVYKNYLHYWQYNFYIVIVKLVHLLSCPKYESLSSLADILPLICHVIGFRYRADSILLLQKILSINDHMDFVRKRNSKGAASSDSGTYSI